MYATIFREQRRRLELPARLDVTKRATAALDRAWRAAARSTADDSVDAVTEALRAAYRVGASRYVRELAGSVGEAAIRFRGPPDSADDIPLDDLGRFDLTGTSFSVTNPRVEKFLRKRAARLVAGVDAETRLTLRRIVADGVANGRSSERIGRDIKRRFTEMAVGRPQLHIDSRAHGIAVTEMSFGYESGQRDVAKRVARAGVEQEKSWLTVGDNRVDDDCEQNAGDGWVGLDDEFSSGDSEPPAHPYCRCTALYRVPPGSLA